MGRSVADVTGTIPGRLQNVGIDPAIDSHENVAAVMVSAHEPLATIPVAAIGKLGRYLAVVVFSIQ